MTIYRLAPFVIAIHLVFSNGCRTPTDPDTFYKGPRLTDWEVPTGDWMIVGDVELNPQDPQTFRTIEGADVLTNGPRGRTSNLLYRTQHGDANVHLEFNVPKGSNSGVYLQGRYEIQILDSWGQQTVTFADCGGIYQRWQDNQGFEGHAPKINASLRPGQWQRLDIVFRAPRFNEQSDKIENARFEEVRLNGVVVHQDVELTGPTRSAAFPDDEKPTGPLMLQGDHGPVAYRNLVIEPLR